MMQCTPLAFHSLIPFVTRSSTCSGRHPKPAAAGVLVARVGVSPPAVSQGEPLPPLRPLPMKASSTHPRDLLALSAHHLDPARSIGLLAYLFWVPLLGHRALPFMVARRACGGPAPGCTHKGIWAEFTLLRWKLVKSLRREEWKTRATSAEARQCPQVRSAARGLTLQADLAL
jgi:hypothetical protein